MNISSYFHLYAIHLHKYTLHKSKEIQLICSKLNSYFLCTIRIRRTKNLIIWMTKIYHDITECISNMQICRNDKWLIFKTGRTILLEGYMWNISNISFITCSLTIMHTILLQHIVLWLTLWHSSLSLGRWVVIHTYSHIILQDYTTSTTNCQMYSNLLNICLCNDISLISRNFFKKVV